MSAKQRLLIYQESLPDYRIPFFNELGKSVDLIVAYSGPTTIKDVKPDLSGIENFRAVELKRKGSYTGLWSYHHGLFSLIDTFKPHGIIAEPRLGLLNAWMLAFSPNFKKQLIWWLSGHEPPESQWKNKLRRWMRKLIYEKARAFVVYGSAGEQYLRRLGLKQEVFIAYNAVGSEEIIRTSESLRNSPTFLDNKEDYRCGKGLSLLFVGRINTAKNTLILPEIITRLQKKENLQESGIVVIGDGDQLAALEQKVSDYGLEDYFRFEGSLFGAERLAPYFLAADIFILPGKGGLAMNEAVQYGLPVVAGKADGTEADLVSPGYNGEIVADGSVEGFVDAIARMSMPGVQQKMSAASLDIAGAIGSTDKMKEGFLMALSSLKNTRHEV